MPAVVEGSVVKGSVVEGSVVEGSVVKGTVVKGTVVKGTVVEATIGHAGRRWWYIWLGVMLGIVFSSLMSWPTQTYGLWLTLPWLAHLCWSAEYRAKRIRLAPDQVQLWSDRGVETFQWQGKGRLSHAFIRFELIREDAQELTLILWHDSVSPASWRALNMAFRVLQSGQVGKAQLGVARKVDSFFFR